MAVVKNIHKLQLSDQDRNKLESGALLHQRYSNIEFKVISANEEEVVIQTKQGKHLSENYADVKTLVTRTKELFGKFFPGKIHVHPNAYVENQITLIDGEWVRDRMDQLGVKVVDIQNDTGIAKANISAWAGGLRPMSQPVKAMFHYYFLFRENAGTVRSPQTYGLRSGIKKKLS